MAILSDPQSLPREAAVYPGHPLTLGLLIMRLYPNLDAAAAVRPGSAYGAALADDRIPGAGSSVHLALDLLRRVRDGDCTAEQAPSLARAAWRQARNAGDHPEAADPGQEQADGLEAEYAACLRAWIEPGRAMPSP